jgi:DNA-binding NtrC family response regulator
MDGRAHGDDARRRSRDVPGLRGRRLRRADGVQTKAAEALGISERVLRYKLAKYGLSGA